MYEKNIFLPSKKKEVSPSAPLVMGKIRCGGGTLPLEVLSHSFVVRRGYILVWERADMLNNDADYVGEVPQ